MEETPQSAIAQLQEKQSSLLTWLDTVAVTNDDEQRNAEDLLICARRALKEADEARRQLTRPLDEAKERIIALFKPYISRLSTGAANINTALHAYHREKSIEAEAARLTALAEEAARIAQAKDTGEIIEPLAQPIQVAVEKTSRANLGTVTYRDDYDIQIVDANQVPRELCEPSMPKIRARVKSGVTSIPGVLISKKYITSTRSS